MKTELDAMVNELYEALEGSQVADDYYERHGIESLGILTVLDDGYADEVVSHLRPRISGKTVVEVGGGIGLLGLHMAQFAKHIYCIEADPAWTSAFVAVLYAAKPKNLTWIFGAAEEMVGHLHADVALFCTHSGHAAMRDVAGKLATTVIDVYDELVGETDVKRRAP